MKAGRGIIPVIVFLLAVFFLGSVHAADKYFGIKVYDANDQFLGLLLDTNSAISIDGVSIFVPSISYPVYIDVDGNTDNSSLYYKSTDCTGQPYSVEWRHLIRPYAGEKVYIPTGAHREIFVGRRTNQSGECLSTNEGPRYPVKEVSLPFPFPISLPLKYVYEAPFGQTFIPVINK